MTNLTAFVWGLLGITALALGAGPRTASNDLYHKIMLILIVATFLLIGFSRRATVSQSETSTTRTLRPGGWQ
jgi:hypothetical protein